MKTLQMLVTLSIPEDRDMAPSEFGRLVREAVVEDLEVFNGDRKPVILEGVVAIECETIHTLTVEYQGWLRHRGLPQESADEIIHSIGTLPVFGLGEDERAYLETFIDRWDAAQERETHSHIARQEVEHGGGNVYSDVLELKDGTVLAVCTETIILYPSRELMNDDEEDPWAFPRIGTATWPRTRGATHHTRSAREAGRGSGAGRVGRVGVGRKPDGLLPGESSCRSTRPLSRSSRRHHHAARSPGARRDRRRRRADVLRIARFVVLSLMPSRAWGCGFHRINSPTGERTMKGKRNNAGRITRSDQAWAAAHREYFDRTRIVDPVEAWDHAHAEYEIRADHDSSPVAPGMAVAILDAPQAPTIAPTPSPHQSLAIPLKFFSAALLAAAKDDIRGYLNGVYVHGVDGELRICATDGHRLVVSRYAPKVALPAWCELGIIIPARDLAQVLPIIGKHGDGQLHSEPPVLIEYGVGAPAMVLRSANMFANFLVAPVEGRFPDYMKVLAAHGASLVRGEGEAMTAAAINVKYLRGAADIGMKLGAKAVHAFVPPNEEAAAVFTFEGAPDTVLIVMAVRTDSPTVSDGVVRMLGSHGVAGSVAALRAHVTRAVNALGNTKDEDERAKIAARKAELEGRIAHLLQLTGSDSNVKQLADRRAA